MSFDKIIERKGTYSIKADGLKKHYGREDLISLWIADMDFESPACVKEALQKVVDGGVYGYNTIPDEYFPTIKGWLASEHSWEVDLQWLTFIPGIVKGIGFAINHFTKEGDGIIIQPPVYPPFRNVPQMNGRKVVYNPLIKNENYTCGASTEGMPYYMDFESLEEIGKEGSCKMLVLSNPHNPGGISWDRESLVKLAQICHKYGILVVSDEIHADMPLFGGKHIPFATVSKEAEAISITFGAPSKTFNIAGIVSSFAVVPNAQLREPFYKWLTANEMNSPTIFATTAAIAAYTQGDPWRKEMLQYIEQNILFTENFFADLGADSYQSDSGSCQSGSRGGQSDPGGQLDPRGGQSDSGSGQLIIPIRPQSSFLVWLDCRNLCTKLGLSHDQLVELFVDKAKLALNSGAAFGPGGEGFMRLNVGSSRELLEKAYTQLKEQVLSLLK